MRVSDFHFDLPGELIAQHPPKERGSSRMLVLDRASGAVRDDQFRNLPGLLRAGDLLVLNDSRVLPARLFATRGGLGTQAGSPRPSGVVEVLLTEEVGSSGERGTGNREQGGGLVWRALVKPAKKVRVGETLQFYEPDSAPGTKGPGPLPAESGYRGLKPAAAPAEKPAATPCGVIGAGPLLTAEVVEAGEFGERTLRFAAVEDFYGRVGRIGHMPLPPYIRRDQAGQPDSEEDRERYQTVYSQRVGSAAAPTAGLHFTPEILAELEARGVEVRYVTLHVGLGTFQPVRVSALKDIRLHAERYTLPAATAEALNRALAEGRRVVAVGTTTTRVLEHIGGLASGAGGEQIPGAKEGGEEEVGARNSVPQGLKPHGFRTVYGTAEAVPLTETDRPGVDRLGKIEAHSGATSIFLAPGHRFRVVGGLLTNFHLPESTLVMLVSAFAGEEDAGRRMVLGAYEHAIRVGYRFYSYGDCMLVV